MEKFSAIGKSKIKNINVKSEGDMKILYSCGFIERNANDGKTFSNRKSTYQRYQDS